jgi:uncharacterized protein (DUF1015 family)
MLEISPFRGLRYNLSRVGDLGDVVCPPYDIISAEEQQRYLRRSRYNVIRLELGQELPSDTEHSDKYTRSAELLRGWVGEEVLLREESPAFYITEHRFAYRGKVQSRWGLTAAVGIQEWGTRNVRPHEAILKEPARDRLNLLRTCRVNFSPVVGMLHFEGAELASLLPQIVGGQSPLSVTDAGSVADNMWILRDQEGIRKLRALCEGTILYILDGHHRYQTALTYKEEQRDSSETANYVMINLVDSGDPGLKMLSTHRMVKVAKDSLGRLAEALQGLLKLERLPRSGGTMEETVEVWMRAMEERAGEGWVVGAYGLYGGDLCLLSAPRKASLMNMMGDEHSEAWKRLDVSLLHAVILEKVMGIDKCAVEGGFLEYTRDPLEAIGRVDSGEFQLAFLLKAIPTSAVMAVADAGDRMPQKSTYLYPKPRTGLVMNPLWDDGL